MSQRSRDWERLQRKVGRGLIHGSKPAKSVLHLLLPIRSCLLGEFHQDLLALLYFEDKPLFTSANAPLDRGHHGVLPLLCRLHLYLLGLPGTSIQSEMALPQDPPGEHDQFFPHGVYNEPLSPPSPPDAHGSHVRELHHRINHRVIHLFPRASFFRHRPLPSVYDVRSARGSPPWESGRRGSRLQRGIYQRLLRPLPIVHLLLFLCDQHSEIAPKRHCYTTEDPGQAGHGLLGALFCRNDPAGVSAQYPSAGL